MEPEYWHLRLLNEKKKDSISIKGTEQGTSRDSGSQHCNKHRHTTALRKPTDVQPVNKLAEMDVNLKTQHVI
jgi:hypothetical protein